jgi:tRNA pseudouridine38-40 synthase
LTRIAVGIEYDGSAYAGWQMQPGIPNIQHTAEAALSAVAAEPVALTCAGRTDAGVHAWGQVAHFDTVAERSPRSWVLGANSALPEDVSLSWAMAVPGHFHARYSAQSRTYRYLVLNRASRAALLARRAVWIHRPLDAAAMALAAAALVGEHDFSAFRSSECQAKSPVRSLTRLAVERQGDWVVIEATANAFLHHMVRNIAGLLLKVGKGDEPPSWAHTVLEGRDRRCGAATAPAQGLYLLSVSYPPAFGLPNRPAPQAPGSDRL